MSIITHDESEIELLTLLKQREQLREELTALDSRSAARARLQGVDEMIAEMERKRSEADARDSAQRRLAEAQAKFAATEKQLNAARAEVEARQEEQRTLGLRLHLAQRDFTQAITAYNVAKDELSELEKTV